MRGSRKSATFGRGIADQDYNQREILVFGLEILMSGNEDTPELAPEGIGLEMVWLKTVIDALDR